MAENTRVTFVLIPSAENILTAFRPSLVIGTFTKMFSCQAANFLPSSTIPSASSAITSELIGPSTISRISLIRVSNETPSFAMSEGFVVTPSMIPHEAYFFMASRFAVSRKNCME